MMYTITTEDLKTQLQLGNVYFSFLKKNNTMKNVNGTLKEELIPKEKRIVNNKNKEYVNLRFFDLDKKEWRSMPKDTKVVTLLYE